MVVVPLVRTRTSASKTLCALSILLLATLAPGVPAQLPPVPSASDCPGGNGETQVCVSWCDPVLSNCVGECVNATVPGSGCSWPEPCILPSSCPPGNYTSEEADVDDAAEAQAVRDGVEGDVAAEYTPEPRQHVMVPTESVDESEDPILRQLSCQEDNTRSASDSSEEAANDAMMATPPSPPPPPPDTDPSDCAYSAFVPPAPPLTNATGRPFAPVPAPAVVKAAPPTRSVTARQQGIAVTPTAPTTLGPLTTGPAAITSASLTPLPPMADELWVLLPPWTATTPTAPPATPIALTTPSLASPLTVYLHTERNGVFQVTALAPSAATCLQYDASTATRDTAGCDAYASLVPPPIPMATGGLPALAVQVEAAVPGFTYDVEVVAYTRAESAVHAWAVGFESQGAGTPERWVGAFAEAGRVLVDVPPLPPAQSGPGAATLAYGFGPADGAGIRVVGGSYEVDAAGAAVAGTGRWLRVAGTHAANVEVTVAGTDAGMSFAIAASDAAQLEVIYDDVHGSVATGAVLGIDFAAQNRASFQATQAAGASLLTWSADAPVPVFEAQWWKQDPAGDEAGEFAAASLPTALRLTTAPGTLRFGADAAPDALSFLHHTNRHLCIDLGTRLGFTSTTDTTGQCLAARLDGYESLDVQAHAILFDAKGARAAGAAAAPTVIAVEGSSWLHLTMAATPEAWQIQAQTAGAAINWTSNASPGDLRLRAGLAGFAATQIDVDLQPASTAFEVVADAATSTFRYAAAAPGDVAITISDTGRRPFGIGGFVAADYEVTSGLQQVRAVLAATQGFTFSNTAEGLILAEALRPAGPASNFEALLDSSHTRLRIAAKTPGGDFALRGAGTADEAIIDITGDLEIYSMSISTSAVGVNLDAQSVVAHARIESDLPNQRFVFEAGGPAHLNFIHWPNHAGPVGSFTVVLAGTGASAPRGATVRLTDVSAFEVQQTGATTLLGGAAGSASQVDVRIDALDRDVQLTTTGLPADARLTYDQGAFEWTAQPAAAPAAPWQDVTYRAADASGRLVLLEVLGSPENAVLSWAAAATDGCWSSTHQPASSATQIEAREWNPGGAPRTWAFDAQDPAPVLAACVNPETGATRITSLDDDGQPQMTGHTALSYAMAATSSPAFGALAGIHLHHDATADGAAAFVGDNVANLAVDLIPEGPLFSGRSTVRIDASGAPLSLHATRPGDGIDVAVVAAGIARGFDFVALAGGSTSEGLAVSATADGAITGLALQSTRPGRAFAFEQSGSTLDRVDVAWRLGLPLQVDLGTPTSSIAVQWAPTLAAAPWEPADDFAYVGPPSGAIGAGFSGADLIVGGRWSGVGHFSSDATTPRLAFEGDASVVPFVLEHHEPNRYVGVHGSDLPDGLDLTWSEAGRMFDYTAAQTVNAIDVRPYLLADAAPRMAFGLRDTSPGAVFFQQQPDAYTFNLTADGVIGDVYASVDAAGSGGILRLVDHGVVHTQVDAVNELFLHLEGIRAATGRLDPLGPTELMLDHTGGGSVNPAVFVFELPGQFAHGWIEQASPTQLLLRWPFATAPRVDFAVVGLTGGHDALLSYGAENHQAWMHHEGITAGWSFVFDPAGRLQSNADGVVPVPGPCPSTVQASRLRGEAVWNGAGLRLDVAGLPPALQVEALPGTVQGSMVTGGGTMSRADFAVAFPGALAEPGVPEAVLAGDDLFVDGRQGGGLFEVDLPNVCGASWDVVAGGVAGDVAIGIERLGANAAPAVAAIVDDVQQTDLAWPQGLPARFALDLVYDPLAWQADWENLDRDVVVQHQTQAIVPIGFVQGDSPAHAGLRIEPKAFPQARYAADGTSGSLRWKSVWNGGLSEADLSGGVPQMFEVDVGTLVSGTGWFSTLGTGVVGDAFALMVPTAPAGLSIPDLSPLHAYVDMVAPTPFASVRANGFDEFEWDLPAAGESTATVFEVGQAPTSTLFAILEGPRDLVNARIRGGVDSSVTPRALPSDLDVPFVVVHGPHTDDHDNEIDGDYLLLSSGQVVESGARNLRSDTTMTAKGLNPSRITMSSFNGPDYARLRVRELVSLVLLELAVNDVTPEVVVDVDRGACDTAEPFRGEISTGGTGYTGAALVTVADAGIAPAAFGNFVVARCLDGLTGVHGRPDTIGSTTWRSSEAARLQSHLGSTETAYSADGAIGTGGGLIVRSHLPSEVILKVEPEAAEETTLRVEFSDSVAGGLPLPDSAVRLTATERVGEWSLYYPHPTRMHFRGLQADGVELGGEGLPTAFHFDVNTRDTVYRTNPSPGVFSSVSAYAEDGERTGSFHADILLGVLQDSGLAGGTSHAELDLHQAQVSFPTPFERVDVYLGNGPLRYGRAQNSLTSNAGDGTSIRLDPDTGKVDFHTVFSNTNEVVADFDHRCGEEAYKNLHYRHDRLVARGALLDWVDLVPCDKEKIFHTLPQALDMETYWPQAHLAEVRVISDGSMDQYERATKRVCETQCAGFDGNTLYAGLDLEGVPPLPGETPQTLFAMEFPRNGTVTRFDVLPLDESGRADAIEIGATYSCAGCGSLGGVLASPAGEPTAYVRASLEDAKLRLKVQEPYAWLDTVGLSGPGSMRIRVEGAGIGLEADAHFTSELEGVDLGLVRVQAVPEPVYMLRYGLGGHFIFGEKNLTEPALTLRHDQTWYGLDLTVPSEVCNIVLYDEDAPANWVQTNVTACLGDLGSVPAAAADQIRTALALRALEEGGTYEAPDEWDCTTSAGPMTYSHGATWYSATGSTVTLYDTVCEDSLSNIRSSSQCRSDRHDFPMDAIGVYVFMDAQFQADLATSPDGPLEAAIRVANMAVDVLSESGTVHGAAQPGIGVCLAGIIPLQGELAVSCGGEIQSVPERIRSSVEAAWLACADPDSGFGRGRIALILGGDLIDCRGEQAIGCASDLAGWGWGYASPYLGNDTSLDWSAPGRVADAVGADGTTCTSWYHALALGTTGCEDWPTSLLSTTHFHLGLDTGDTSEAQGAGVPTAIVDSTPPPILVDTTANAVAYVDPEEHGVPSPVDASSGSFDLDLLLYFPSAEFPEEARLSVVSGGIETWTDSVDLFDEPDGVVFYDVPTDTAATYLLRLDHRIVQLDLIESSLAMAAAPAVASCFTNIYPRTHTWQQTFYGEGEDYSVMDPDERFPKDGKDYDIWGATIWYGTTRYEDSCMPGFTPTSSQYDVLTAWQGETTLTAHATFPHPVQFVMHWRGEPGDNGYECRLLGTCWELHGVGSKTTIDKAVAFLSSPTIGVEPLPAEDGADAYGYAKLQCREKYQVNGAAVAEFVAGVAATAIWPPSAGYEAVVATGLLGYSGISAIEAETLCKAEEKPQTENHFGTSGSGVELRRRSTGEEVMGAGHILYVATEPATAAEFDIHSEFHVKNQGRARAVGFGGETEVPTYQYWEGLGVTAKIKVE